MRAALVTLCLPLLLGSILGLSAAYRIYAGNRALTEEHQFPAMPAPRASERLLVIAPHCDDETLGAAGLMRQAARAGADVRVVVCTNGDGFRVGVERDFHELTVPPADFVRYAYRRQTETRTALRVLGLPPGHITFLGYPDRGLMPMWTTNWPPSTPFRSPYTQDDHSPYDDAPTPHAPYCGAALLDDLKRQMQADRPTDIFVTHPGDDHPDHAAASVFVQTALAQLKAQGVGWTQTARLHFYLVHRGDWPAPQGLHEDFALTPPAPMAHLDTRWEQLPLSLRDVQKKYAAIKRYPSQTEMTGRFLFSFARRDELFGSWPDARGPQALTVVSDGRVGLGSKPSDWKGIAPLALDPAADTIARSFQSGADVTRLLACRDARFLYVRLDTQRSLSPEIAYRLVLRPVRPGPTQPPCLSLSVTPRREGIPQAVAGAQGVQAEWRGRALTLRVPLAEAGLADADTPAQTLFLAAETRFAGVVIDRTGFRAAAPSVPARTASRAATE